MSCILFFRDPKSYFNEVFYLKYGQHGLKEVVKICSRGIQFVIESKQQRNIDIAQTCNENLPSYIKLNKTPAKAFTPPAEKKISTRWSLVEEVNE